MYDRVYGKVAGEIWRFQNKASNGHALLPYASLNSSFTHCLCHAALC